MERGGPEGRISTAALTGSAAMDHTLVGPARLPLGTDRLSHREREAPGGVTPPGDIVPESRADQAGSPIPRQLTLGFQSLKMPLGFGRQSQTCSS